MPHSLDYIRQLIAKCTWTFAKTMPQWPHEYIVRGKCALTDEEFLYLVHMQREHGIVMKWGPYNFPYLIVDGYRYWTMGSPYEETIILNRAKGEETQPL